jgi:hypothetical protein
MVLEYLIVIPIVTIFYYYYDPEDEGEPIEHGRRYKDE